MYVITPNDHTSWKQQISKTASGTIPWVKICLEISLTDCPVRSKLLTERRPPQASQVRRHGVGVWSEQCRQSGKFLDRFSPRVLFLCLVYIRLTQLYQAAC